MHFKNNNSTSSVCSTEARRRELEDMVAAGQSPIPRADSFSLHDLIDPRETRPLLVDFIEDAQEIIRTQLGPTSRIPYLP